MKKISTLLLLLVLIFLLGCSESVANDKKEKSISIKGDFTVEVEIGTKYEDPGVNMPEGYNLKIEDYYLIELPGIENEIKYKVYSPEGELVKELSRFVKFVDTTGPTYPKTSIKYINAGDEYKVSDFILDYSDNYDSKNKIIVISDLPKRFSGNGETTVEIEFKDTCGNITKYSEKFVVVFDLDAIVEKWKSSNLIRYSTGSGVGESFRVQIDEKTSLSYYKSGTFHMIKRVDSELGSYASIQLSGPLWKYEKTNVDYHISNTGSSAYSVGFATIDGTRDYDSLIIDSFSGRINDLNLDADDMLNELNMYLLDFYKEFSLYKNYNWNSLFD